jgi:hypothetical protein
MSTIQKMEPGIRINLFRVMPQADVWAEAIFWVLGVSAIFLSIGFLTRFSSVAVFLCLTSIQQRNLYIIHSGDAFLRVAGAFLMFAPAGAALSFDRLIRIARGREGTAIQPTAPWAQRMIQLETALVYLVASWWKSTGESWINGTAIYYVFNLDEFRRFALPSWAQHPTIAKLGSWFTIALEFALGSLVWIKEFRYPLLLTGLCFHLILEYSLNVPLFQWVLLSTYVLFIDPDDLTRAWAWVTRFVTRKSPDRIVVIYDIGCTRQSRVANLLEVSDVFNKINFSRIGSSLQDGTADTIEGAGRVSTVGWLTVLVNEDVFQDFQALVRLSPWIPALWPFALLRAKKLDIIPDAPAGRNQI